MKITLQIAAFLLLAGQFAAAQAVRTGFTVAGTQQRTDDNFSGPVAIGFPINFFGTTYSNLYVGTNGYVTFDRGQTGYNPENLTTYTQKIIAAFYADVDTRNPESGLITWGNGTVGNRPAFAVTWTAVGYFRARIDRRNTFQIVLINRSDRAQGDFDVELNYNQIQWEAGEDNGGTAGLCGTGCQPASAGYSNGLSGANNRSFEVRGSRIPGAFLDSNASTGLRNQQAGNSGVNGRLLFPVSNGQITPLTITNITPNSANAGAPSTNIAITGTGFATNATVRWTFNGTTTNLTNVQVPTSTSITATIPATLLTTAGTAQITVANAAGTPSPARDFVVNATGATITDLTPSTAVQSSAAVPITISGTNFAAGATVRWTFGGQNSNLTNVTVASATRITATIPANLLLAAGTSQIAVVQNGIASNPRDFTVTALPLPTLTLATTPVVVSGQSNVTLTFAAPAPAALTGTVALSFAPSVSVPAGTSFNEVQFANGLTTLDFTVASGSTTATLPNGGQFSPGTVAGTITVTVTALNRAGVSALPNPRPTTTVVIARSVPVITSGSVRILNLTATGFTLEVQGYSPTRELTSMGIAFSNAAGGTLDGTTTYNVSLANAQSVWFDTAEGRSNGSKFSIRLPFGYSGDTRAIGSASVTLSNSVGASVAVSGGQ